MIINLLSHPILDRSISGIRDELKKLESSGRVKLTEMNANGEMDKLGVIAREAVALSPRVIVPVSTPVTQAVFKAAPAGQSILFSTVTNPSDVGMDTSPKNMSGVCDVVSYRANLDLILELFPKTKSVGMVYNPGERNAQFGVDEVRKLVTSKGIKLEVASATKSTEVSDATRSLVGKVDVLYVGSDNTVVSAIAALVKVAEGAKLPVIASDIGSVEGGALAAVSVDYAALGKKAGEMVSTLVEHPTKSAGSLELVRFVGDALILNKKTAASTGFTFPDAVLKRAARVIE